MDMKSSALAIACAATLISCAPSTEEPHTTQGGLELAFVDDPARDLEERVLLAIEGFFIAYPDPPHDGAPGETFGCGGAWSTRSVWSEDLGRYTITGDRICVEAEARNYCVTYIGRDNETLTVRTDDGVEAHYAMRRSAYCEPDPAGGPSRNVTYADVRTRQHIRGEELRELVRGASLYDPASGLANQQLFSCNGRWSGADQNLRGRYTITEDLVCTDVGRRDQCEKYFRIDGGTYAAQTLPDGRAINARRVEVLEQEVCE